MPFFSNGTVLRAARKNERFATFGLGNHAPRGPKGTDYVNYFFLTRAEFESASPREAMLEHTEYVGQLLRRRGLRRRVAEQRQVWWFLKRGRRRPRRSAPAVRSCSCSSVRRIADARGRLRGRNYRDREEVIARRLREGEGESPAPPHTTISSSTRTAAPRRRAGVVQAEQLSRRPLCGRANPRFSRCIK